MTSDQRSYAWIWLPGRPDPVPCGVIERAGSGFAFNYGRSYLANPEAVAL